MSIKTKLYSLAFQFQVLQNMSSPCNNNIGYILAMEDRLKDVSISNAESIKDHLTIQAEVAQHSWSETEKNLENSVKHGINELKESHATSLQIVGNKVDATRSDVKEVKEKQEKTQHTQGKAFFFYFSFFYGSERIKCCFM